MVGMPNMYWWNLEHPGFIEVDPLSHLTVKHVINHCRSQFSRYGIPDSLISDNGPQFSSHEFLQFVKQYQIDSSPYHTQSNGITKKAVKTVKRLMKKARQDGNLALLECRNTPWSDTLGSPAQHLMGRRIKTLLPASSTLLKPEPINLKMEREEFQKQGSKQKLYYERSAKLLKGLAMGDSVMMMTKDGKWKPAKVVSINQTAPHSYNIVTTQGQQYCRNRKDLRNVAGGTSIGSDVDDF